jgi:hypothetical protein
MTTFARFLLCRSWLFGAPLMLVAKCGPNASFGVVAAVLLVVEVAVESLLTARTRPAK